MRESIQKRLWDSIDDLPAKMLNIYRNLAAKSKLEKSDIIQELSLTGWKAASKWIPGKGAKFNNYAYELMKRRMYELAVAANRRKRKPPGNSLESIGDPRIKPYLPASITTTDDIDLKVSFESCLKKMTRENQNLCAYLLLGFTQEEIAEKVGCAQSRVSKKIKKMRQELAGHMDWLQ